MNAAHDWDAAYERVESYLRAHQLRSRRQVARLADELVRAAQANQREGETAVAAAMRVTDGCIGAWLTAVLGDSATRKRERVGVRGRLTMVITDAPARWPEQFLGEGAPPPEMIEAMRTAYLEAGPELEFSNMATRPIDLGPIANLAGDAWETWRRWPWLRMAVGWSLLLAAMVALWVLTR
jgi:hypothetical protein